MHTPWPDVFRPPTSFSGEEKPSQDVDAPDKPEHGTFGYGPIFLESAKWLKFLAFPGITGAKQGADGNLSETFLQRTAAGISDIFATDLASFRPLRHRGADHKCSNNRLFRAVADQFEFLSGCAFRAYSIGIVKRKNANA